jgi:hypothetical protein
MNPQTLIAVDPNALADISNELARLHRCLDHIGMVAQPEWINKGRSWLTRRGPKVKAIRYDTQGRHVTCGGDFMRATKDEALPVRWLWPDQVAEMAAKSDLKINTWNGRLEL